MASSFAAQLRTIAQNSTHELDLRARRTAHAESLLFPKDVAAKQDFDTIYAICIEGFRELCSLDAAFVEFERNLYSAQSVRTDREQMNEEENEALDKVLERCLVMLGSKLLLKPGVRCLEWLVRRFRVHVYNVSALLLAVLPWHEMSVWRNVLSIVPKEKCTAQWKFLGMYKEEALNVPRSAVVYAMAHNDGFFALLNRHVIDAGRDGTAHAGLIKFWTSMAVEAVISRLDATRSGRKEVQRQRTEDFLLKILPVLSDGFEVREYPDLITGCFTLAMVLAGKADLDDRVLDSLLHAVATTAEYVGTERQTALVTMIVIMGQKQNKIVPRPVLNTVTKLSNLEVTLLELRDSYPIGMFVEALLQGALSGIKKKNIESRLHTIERMIRFANSLTHQVVSNAAAVVLKHILSINTSQGFEDVVRTSLIEMLQRLNEERSISLAISEASQRLNQDTTQIEALLGSTVALIEAAPTANADVMEVDLPISVTVNIDTILADIPSRTVDSVSFLGKYNQRLYMQLIECFSACCKSAANLQKFTSLPFWSSSQSKGLLFDTLMLRVAVGPFSDSQKVTALRLLTQTLASDRAPTDAQAFLPYILTSLSNKSQSVRRSAADLLITVGEVVPGNDDSTQKIDSKNLYEEEVQGEVKWIATSHIKKIIEQALLPSLEECVLDGSQTAQMVQNALNGLEGGNQTPSKLKQTELKKSFRHDLFELLTSHAVATSSLRVKIAIIQLLHQVNKVGVTTKSKALNVLFRTWSSKNEADATQLAETEAIQLSDVDQAVVEIISPNDKDAVGSVLSMVEEKNSVTRIELVAALFERIKQLWPQLKHDTQVSSAHKMFELAFQDNTAVATGSQNVLRSARLATNILGTLLEQSAAGISQAQTGEEHPKKKRRTSSGRDSLPPDLGRVVKSAASRLTFALELVDESNPETRPELLPVLFDVLSVLKRLRQQQRMALPYLDNLCLNNILTIIESQRNVPKATIDISSIRADLVTDCIRSSENPQVQTTALLLSASLASIAPDRMLHNVMPIFTFMGQSMFSRDDEHSIHVVNQAIDKIIPALVESLRNQSKDLVKSTSSLLASFIAAYDHIPQHRRVATYSRLLTRMGAQDFTFVVLAMLAQRKASHSTFDLFFNELLSELDAETQLLTFQKLIQLANDILSPKPLVAEEVFGITDGLQAGQRQHLSKIVFRTGINVLKSKTLKAQARKIHRLEPTTATSLRSEINGCFNLVLSTIRDRRKDGSPVVEEAKQCLDVLLALPALSELFTIIPEALASTDIDADLKPQALRVLASQLQNNPAKDSNTRTAAIELLIKLTGMLSVESDISMRQAIIVCIDRLSEVYGKKDVDVVISAASIISSEQCLGSGDRRLEVMSLLCLASMLEVLKEACIPIVPEMMSKTIDILRDTIQQEHEDEEIYNSAFALIAAVVTHVPFLVSDEYLQAILVLSALSASKYESVTSTESRTEALSIIARKVDLASLLMALSLEDLDVVREHPEDAELEHLTVFSAAVGVANKASIIKNADTISRLLLAHLDQRARLMSAGDVIDDNLAQAVENVENKVNLLSIDFIYKLNDTVFRPIFESWVDWATNAYDVSDLALREILKPLRRTSLFGLMTHFFETLKSIVTAYASYLIPISHEILAGVVATLESKKQTQLSVDTKLHTALLTMLQTTFTHDADSFYGTPSHFEPIASPLVDQLKLAATKAQRPMVYTHVVPTIVSLAIATLDTPSNHQTISHGLVQLRHAPSAAVRLASIKTFAAMTADENVGEEFIANVIGIGGGEGEGARGIGGGGSVGEIMIYVNEMLEDDDEDVEREVRKWVQSVREKTGEDVFEV